ncbi:MAG TPA: chemotaxis protein CheW [Candidatus Acidoferrales bacterium]|nr:chemotaxis protein CheW [Candidatus Acidoferrales bacterium]
MKIAPSEWQLARKTGRTEAVILFTISGQMFAITASAIHEIRSTDSISGVASEIEVQGLSKVRHVVQRGRKAYYVVNGCAHFNLAISRPTLVLVLRHTHVAVLVDAIDRMETISLLMALPASFSGPERAWYRGVTLIGEDIVPVVNPSGFLTENELARLEAVAKADDAAASENVQGDASEETKRAVSQ